VEECSKTCILLIVLLIVRSSKFYVVRSEIVEFIKQLRFSDFVRKNDECILKLMLCQFEKRVVNFLCNVYLYSNFFYQAVIPFVFGKEQLSLDLLHATRNNEYYTIHCMAINGRVKVFTHMTNGGETFYTFPSLAIYFILVGSFYFLELDGWSLHCTRGMAKLCIQEMTLWIDFLYI
jgi:hypothetical protein